MSDSIFGEEEDIFQGNPDDEGSEQNETVEKEPVPTIIDEKKEVKKETSIINHSKAISSNQDDSSSSVGIAKDKDSLFKQSLIEYAKKDKDSFLELMMLIEELIHISKASSIALNNDLDEKKKSNVETKRITQHFEDSKANLKLILFALDGNLDKHEKIFDSFASDIEEIIKSVDLSMVEKEVTQIVTSSIHKIPYNEINNGVTTSISLLKRMSDALKVANDDAKITEEKLYASRKLFKGIYDDMSQKITEFEEISKRASGKRFNFTHLLLVSILSVIITLGGSVYFYQDFFGSKIDDLIEAERSSGVTNLRDSRGDYILIKKEDLKLVKVNKGKSYKVYYKKY